MTLIEVVAGLALLAAIMASLLLAKSHWQRTLSAADQRLAANSAADALLGAWWQNPLAFPIQSSGAVPQHPEMRWRTFLVNNRNVEQLGARVVRLEILPVATDDAPPLSAVELVLPNPGDFHD